MSKNIIKLVDEYATLKAQIAELEAQAKKLGEKVKSLGDGTYEGTAHKLVVSSSIPVRFDSTTFRQENAELYEKYTKQGELQTTVRVYGR